MSGCTRNCVITCCQFPLFLLATTAWAGADRQWTDRDGEGVFHGELVKVEGKEVSLKNEEWEKGKMVSLTDLSDQDQRYVRLWQNDKLRPALERCCELGHVGLPADDRIEIHLEGRRNARVKATSVLPSVEVQFPGARKGKPFSAKADLELLTTLPQVVSLEIRFSEVKDDDLAVLSGLRSLLSLKLMHVNIDGSGFRHLSKLDRLEEFEYWGDGNQQIGAHLTHLSSLKLKRLTLQHCPLSSDEVAALGSIKGLEKLDLSFAQLESPFLGKLKNLSNLRSLGLSECIVDDKDAVHFKQFPELRELVFFGAEFGRAGMEHLTQLKHLEKLELPWELQDDDLAPLGKIKSLRSLTIFSTRIGDEGLGHLADLENLEELVLSVRVTRKGLAQLGRLNRLKRLQFIEEETKLSDALNLLVDIQGRSVEDALTVISGHGEAEREWKSLNGLGPKLDAEALGYLSRLPKLEELTLPAETDDRSLKAIGWAQQLRKLRLSGGRHGKRISISAEGCKHLAGLKHLQALDCEHCDFKAGSFAELASLGIQELTLRNCTLARKDLAEIGKLSLLRTLVLWESKLASGGLLQRGSARLGLDFGQPLSDADMGFVSTLTNLEQLSISDQVSMEGLAHLKQLKRLRSLKLADQRNLRFADVMALLMNDIGCTRQEAATAVLQTHAFENVVKHLYWDHYDGFETTADDLAVLNDFPHLEILGLPANVTDEGMKHLAPLGELEDIQIRSDRLTDEGIKVLLGLKKLKVLNIENAPITDKAYKELAKLPKLEHLRVEKTRVTTAAAQELMKTRPEVHVVHQ